MANATPDDLVIHPRDISFRCKGGNERWWMGSDPVATAYYNAFSASFPQAERYFIDAVRRYRDRAGPVLQKQIAAFIAQESMHSREHVAFNREAICGGYDLARINEILKSRFDRCRKLSPLVQIASTAALEHFTTILAREAVGNPPHLETAPAEIRRLWSWHAGEEMEHKAVAFDTLMLATERLTRAGRWLLRACVMVASTWYLFNFMVRGVEEFFRQDGIASPVTWLKFLKFAFITPGVIRRVSARYLSWYVPGFHPWQTDDRALIARAEQVIGAEPAR